MGRRGHPSLTGGRVRRLTDGTEGWRCRWRAYLTGSGGATSGRARSNDPAGRSTALAPPCLLLCFASVIVWTENSKNTISDRWPLYLFYFDNETISAALAAFVFWARRLEKRSSKWPGAFAALAPPLLTGHPGGDGRPQSRHYSTTYAMKRNATVVYFLVTQVPSPWGR